MDARNAVALIDDLSRAIAAPLVLMAEGMNSKLDRALSLSPTPAGMRALHTALLLDVQTAASIAASEFKAAQVAIVQRTSEEIQPPGLDVAPFSEASLNDLQATIKSGLLSFATGLSRHFRERLLGAASLSAATTRIQLRNGIRMRAEEFISLAVRKAVASFFNSLRILKLRAEGIQFAVIRHVDPDHEANGLVISLVEGNFGKTFAEHENDNVFHPRSRAVVEAL